MKSEYRKEKELQHSVNILMIVLCAVAVLTLLAIGLTIFNTITL